VKEFLRARAYSTY